MQRNRPGRSKGFFWSLGSRTKAVLLVHSFFPMITHHAMFHIMRFKPSIPRVLWFRSHSFFPVLAMMVAGFLCISHAPAETAIENVEQATQLETIPFPDALDENWCRDMAVDESGVLWVISNRRLYQLKGRDFVEPLPDHQSFLYLVGGPDRGLFAAMAGREHNHDGRLLRLRNGAAEEAGTYYRYFTDDERPMHVSKSGVIITWSERFLAARNTNGEWDRIDARLSKKHTRVFDVGDTSFVYYNNELYSVDEKGRLQARACAQWDSIQPGRETVKAALWSDSHALLVNNHSGKLLAFDLVTGEPHDLEPAFAPFGSMKFHDVFSLKNGDVLLLSGERPSTQGYTLYLLTADGSFSPLPDAEGIHNNAGRLLASYGYRLTLELAGGEILFGGANLLGRADNRLSIYRNGAFDRWGWREGFTHPIHDFVQTPDGDVWFPMDRGLVRMRLAAGPPSRSEMAQYWEDFPLVGISEIWPMEPGVIGVFRRDHPDSFSRWNGGEWTHQKVPLKPSNLHGISAIDDRGSLIISHWNGAIAIDRDQVRSSTSLVGLIEQSVADGVRTFPFMTWFAGIIVTPNGELWYAKAERAFYGNISVFDGANWRRVPTDQGYLSIHESPRHGVLLKKEGGFRYLQFDGERLLDLVPELPTAFLMNDRGFWPYEKEIVDRDPNGNVPIILGDDRFIAFSRDVDLEAIARAPIPRGSYLEETIAKSTGTFSYLHLKRSLSGGGWVYKGKLHTHSGVPLRLIDGNVRRYSFEGTPLSKSSIHDVVEDGTGGLWFLLRSSNNTAYRYVLPTVEIATTSSPRKEGRELVVDFALTSDRSQEGMELFKRIDSGPWRPIEKGRNECVFRFEANGRFRCEIAAFEYGAKLSESLVIEVDVELDSPKPKLADTIDAPVMVKELLWHPPVVFEEGESVPAFELLWSVDGGPWQEVSADGGVLLAELVPGSYSIHFSTTAGESQGDAPLRINIDYRPDYEKIVDHWLPMLLDTDRDVRDDAMTRFGKFIPGAIPVLQARLAEARKAKETADAIQGIVRDLGVRN